jgi:exopolyphosphatase/guanosine-5'-triphosphate,3'-diphosphate pyrophosphatase
MATRYAVFDLGSNSVKFLVAERWGKSFRLVREVSRPTRLAEDLIHTGTLKPEAMNRTVKALAVLRKEADDLGVSHWDAVATSAVRDSGNRKAFLRAAKEALGFPVRLLSGVEEAEAIFEGVTSDPYWRKKELLVVDVGGGSAEWVQGSGGKIARRISLPLGCVRLRERFVTHHPVGVAMVEKIQSVLHGQLQPALASYRLDGRILVGTGGTATCLAAMNQELREFDAAAVNHYALTRRQLGGWLDRLARMSWSELLTLPGLPHKRTDLIIPGAAVLYVTMEILGARRLVASTRGLRYGILHRLMRR